MTLEEFYNLSEAELLKILDLTPGYVKHRLNVDIPERYWKLLKVFEKADKSTATAQSVEATKTYIRLRHTLKKDFGKF